MLNAYHTEISNRYTLQDDLKFSDEDTHEVLDMEVAPRKSRKKGKGKVNIFDLCAIHYIMHLQKPLKSLEDNQVRVDHVERRSLL